MAISHADHNHPNTPAARAACRRRLILDGTTTKPVPAERVLAEQAGVVKPAKITVIPRTRGDGGVVKGLKNTKPKTTTTTLKRENTKIKAVGDLADMPQMLAYAVKLAWAAGLDVVVGHPFNDQEANIVIQGPVAHITCMWRVAQPHGIYDMHVRPVDSSRGAGRATSAQQAVDIARGVAPLPQ